MSNAKRVLLVDDHVLFLQCAKAYLSSSMTNISFDICSELSKASKLLDNKQQVDLVILDYHMPGSKGASTVGHFVTEYPDTRFAVISGRATKQNITDCISAGVSGFVLKDISTDELQNAIELMLKGRIYLPDSVFSAPLLAAETSDGIHLTRREMETLELVHDGLPNKAISRELNITEVTVKMHLKNLLRKYGVKNRTELVVNSSDDVTVKHH